MKENIIPAGENTIKAHLEHLRDHNETVYLQEAINYLKEQNIYDNTLSNVTIASNNFSTILTFLVIDSRCSFFTP